MLRQLTILHVREQPCHLDMALLVLPAAVCVSNFLVTPLSPLCLNLSQAVCCVQVEGSALKSRKPTYCYDEGDLQRLQAQHSGQTLSLQRFKVGCLLLALKMNASWEEHCQPRKTQPLNQVPAHLGLSRTLQTPSMQSFSACLLLSMLTARQLSQHSGYRA